MADMKKKSCIKNFNNLYNFKNPIRHFFNLDQIIFDDSKEFLLDDLSWTEPVKFKIYKTENENRTISFPNVLNFYHAIKIFKTELNFSDIKLLSRKKRVSPDLEIGEFSALSYYESLKKDIFNLTKYDNLLIMDIKSFYGRIYTHDLNFNEIKEKRVTSMNLGRTNGLLLGSYLSLFIAEKYLLRIEQMLDEEIVKEKINCHYEYFSDDFYFFCNKYDIEKIKTIFEKVLNKCELQVNHEKTMLMDFEEYSKNNNLEKLWKKIINISIAKDENAERERSFNKKHLGYPAFFTQLVYRLNQIKDIKYKRIFLANFFKTYYFNNLKPKTYKLSESDFNYICYIYKLMPETIIYSLPKIKDIENFDMLKFKDFISIRFEASLRNERDEEQVYFYYAMKLCGFKEELEKFKTLVVKTENQVLISYFLMDKIITKEEYEGHFFFKFDEKEWLQNYHYLLTYDKSNLEILIPAKAKGKKSEKNYYNFYKTNLYNNIPLLKPIEDVEAGIQNFVQAKIDSYGSKHIEEVEI